MGVLGQGKLTSPLLPIWVQLRGSLNLEEGKHVFILTSNSNIASPSLYMKPTIVGDTRDSCDFVTSRNSPIFLSLHSFA